MTDSMMAQEWQAILSRHGLDVTVFARRDGEGQSGRALIQPILEQTKHQLEPSPLGGRCESRFRYLGEPGLPLEAGKGGRVECALGAFSIQSAHPIQIAGNTSHWWGVLRPMDRKGQVEP